MQNITEYREPANAVSSFFNYMWNAWDMEECKIIEWGCSWEHVWSKWMYYCDKYGPNGAIGPFYGELDHNNRAALVRQAMLRYDGATNL